MLKMLNQKSKLFLLIFRDQFDMSKIDEKFNTEIGMGEQEMIELYESDDEMKVELEERMVSSLKTLMTSF